MEKKTTGLDVETAASAILQGLRTHLSLATGPPRPYIIAIAGKVAVGKSFFVQHLTRRVRETFRIPVVNFPFEIWLDPERASQSTYRYADKFFLSRFVEDLTDLSSCVPFFLMHTEQGLSAKTRVKHIPDGTQWYLQHKGRSYSHYWQTSLDATPLYVNQQTLLLERKMVPHPGEIYIIDGTLVFSPCEVRALYDASVYLDAPWMIRLARMRARFWRGESHNMRQASLDQYVAYLADEAVSSADAEIESQRHLTEHFVWNDADPNNDVEHLLRDMQSGAINLRKYL